MKTRHHCEQANKNNRSLLALVMSRRLLVGYYLWTRNEAALEPLNDGRTGPNPIQHTRVVTKLMEI